MSRFQLCVNVIVLGILTSNAAGQAVSECCEGEILEGRESGGVSQLSDSAGTKAFQQDFAQESLGDDWFLNSSGPMGNAVVHLDVPFAADVTVTYFPDQRVQTKDAHGNPMFDDQQQPIYESKPGTTPATRYSVKSRGRYRHLVINNVRSDKRVCYFVEACLWLDDPLCNEYPQKVCRKVYLQAGDRKYLTIKKRDFKDAAAGKDTGALECCERK